MRAKCRVERFDGFAVGPEQPVEAFGANAFLFKAEWTLVVAEGGRKRGDGIADAG